MKHDRNQVRRSKVEGLNVLTFDYRLLTFDLPTTPLRTGLTLALLTVVGLLLPGCAATQSSRGIVDRLALRTRALNYLTAAIRYPHNPAVRVEAVEALETCGQERGLPWLRSALMDDHPAVRFAACVAVGARRDGVASNAVHAALDDPDASVQVAALFALHRFGRKQRTGRIATFLLNHESPAVRRNAALVLGLLEEPGAIKVLARAMKDADAGVRQHALEAMARLGNAEASQELAFMANTGVGSEEVFALNALAATGNPVYQDTFRYKLATAPHIETRLAAARGLGLLGSTEGFEIALGALRPRGPLLKDARDPPQGQILRRRQLAAAALGAMGQADALPALSEMLEESGDPRVQVSAARAILDILETNRPRALPAALTPTQPTGNRPAR